MKTGKATPTRYDKTRQVILVDSSVWSDYFHGVSTPQTEPLDSSSGLALSASSKRCIAGGLTLLYSDRGFDSFVRHLGLHTALPGIAGMCQA